MGRNILETWSYHPGPPSLVRGSMQKNPGHRPLSVQRHTSAQVPQTGSAIRL